MDKPAPPGGDKPAPPGADKPAPSGADKPVSLGTAQRLLIVDDEQDMLDFLERVFRREYEVSRAQSVEEAERELAKNDAYDVVITDRRMPRRSGLELLEIVSKTCPRAVRVLLTGYAESLVNEKVAQWALVDAWVSKPIDSAALKQAIAEAKARRQNA